LVKVRQALKIAGLMVLFLSFFSSNTLQAQRVRYGYQYPCYEQPAPLPPVTAAPETLCERFPESGKVIEIGTGTKLVNSSDLIALLGTNTVNDIYFKVVGDFFINENITFRFCNLSISEDKTITVGPEVTLESITSHFFCCNGMWKGIVVDNDAYLYLFRYTEIEDAYKAVYATNTAADIKIDKTTFNRNQVACYFTYENNNSGSTIPLTMFSANTFTCTSELNVTKGYRWAICGVSVLDAFVPALGTDGDRPNLFTGNICNGIYLDKSFAVIRNCQFIKIYADFANLSSNLFDRGAYAVVAEKSFLNLAGLGGNSASPFTFNNNARGAVFTNASMVTIKGCAVRSVVEDTNINSDTEDLEKSSNIIHCINNRKYERIDISENYFAIYDDVNVVSIEKSNGKMNSISSNTFESVPSSNTFAKKEEHTMIYVSNANTSASTIKIFPFSPITNNATNLEIFNNTIRILQHESKIIGIRLDGKSANILGKVRINNKVIGNQFFDFCGYDAIVLESVSRTQVSLNHIRGYMSPSGNPIGRGLVITGTTEMPSTSNVVCTNTIDFTQTNYDFKGLCNGLSFGRNGVERCQVGLKLSPFSPPLNGIYQPVIGQQFATNKNGSLTAFENVWRWDS
jgi:hypothetical protein